MILNIEEIKKLIPHREPFLFIDTCDIKIPGEQYAFFCNHVAKTF